MNDNYMLLEYLAEYFGGKILPSILYSKYIIIPNIKFTIGIEFSLHYLVCAYDGNCWTRIEYLNDIDIITEIEKVINANNSYAY